MINALKIDRLLLKSCYLTKRRRFNADEITEEIGSKASFF